ncbi:MAG: hypothetical protein JSV61_11405, partial [Anaerolineales bacterium]
MSGEYTPKIADVIAKENEILASRREKAAREFELVEMNKRLEKTGQMRKLTSAQQAYQLALSLPVQTEAGTGKR